MSRIRIFGASVVAIIASAGGVVAGDLPVYQSSPTAPAYDAAPAFSWSGPYAGLTGGYGWGGTTITNNGWIGGAYAGSNFQLDSNIVVGVEGDFTFTGKSGTAGTTTVSNPWDTTLRARIGYAADRFMFYGTGGLAVGRVKAVDTVGPTTETATKVGWTVGAGVEAALTGNVIGRLEVRHTNLGTTTFPVAGPVAYKSNDVMVGIGVKF